MNLQQSFLNIALSIVLLMVAAFSVYLYTSLTRLKEQNKALASRLESLRSTTHQPLKKATGGHEGRLDGIQDELHIIRKVTVEEMEIVGRDEKILDLKHHKHPQSFW